MATKFKTDTCKGCGKPIVWGRDPGGKMIPLDPRPPVYVVIGGERTTCERTGAGENVMGHPLGYMVSHFATCPKAADFSGRRSKNRTTT